MSMYRSASMYRSPYGIYKPPPPKINYPPLFSGCECSFRYFMESKILLIGVSILGVAAVVALGMIVAPFWFQLTLDRVDATFGQQPIMRELNIDTGIFYMRSTEFDNLNFMDRFTNRDVLPKALQAAQVFCVLGICLLISGFAAGVILIFRRFGSPPAVIILAGAVTLAAVCEILMVVTCIIALIMSSCAPNSSDCSYRDNLEWRMIPLYTQFYRVEQSLTPYVEANWAFYIACVGAALSIGAAVLLWIEAISTSRTLGKIRYQQLRRTRDPHENDFNPYTGQKYLYRAPIPQGPNTFGMQPIAPAGAYSGVVVFERPPSDAYIPPPSYRPPSPRMVSKGPPSTHSSTSGPRGLQEIDL